MENAKNNNGWLRRTLVASLVLVIGGGMMVGGATAQGSDVSDGAGFLAIGAGLAIGLAGLGTGVAQSQIGAAGVGATAENEKNFGKAIVFVALPETIVLFGFVIAFLLMGNI